MLNYGQDLTVAPILEFRDDRTTVSCESGTRAKRRLQATDDGGVFAFRVGHVVRNMALLEAKRRFQVVEDGKPIVSDGLLAQMVGQALISRIAAGPGSGQVERQVPSTLLRQFHLTALMKRSSL